MAVPPQAKVPSYVLYFRVSTDRQGTSRLGLDAQQQAVKRFVGNGKVIDMFVEIESGKHHANRPQLLTALATCRKFKATLVIASLDRLARNVAFIATLMESGTDFIAADMPQANRLTIHVLAAVAEHERELISKRTKVALAEAKRRGTRLGNPRIHEARPLALAAIRAKQPAQEIMDLMRGWRGQGKTLRTIADGLNRLNVTPARGRQWYASSVRNQLLSAEREHA